MISTCLLQEPGYKTHNISIYTPTFTSEHRGTRWNKTILVFLTAMVLGIDCIDDYTYQCLNDGRHRGGVKLVLSTKNKNLHLICDVKPNTGH